MTISTPITGTIESYERHIQSEGFTPIELLRLTRRFLRSARHVDPDRYRAVLKRYPVKQNIRRDEKAREVSLEGGAYAINLRMARETEWD